jgi:hypothetical protein
MQDDDGHQRREFAALLVEIGKLLHGLHRYGRGHHRHGIHHFP